MQILWVGGLVAMMACGGGGGGDSFANAVAVSIGTGVKGTLANANTKDYYKVTLAAGERIAVATQTNATTIFDGSVTDTVVTWWDSGERAIAQDDDGWPRESTDSSFYSQARSAGDYYITVEDCNSAFGSTHCKPPAMITDFAYTLFLLDDDADNFPETNAAATQDGTVVNAQSVAYREPTDSTAGDYGGYVIDGTFRSTTDTHVFGFVPPANTAVGAGERARADFWVQPIGAANGDGSTANAKVWVTDSSGATILAQADEFNYSDGDSPNEPIDLSVPVTLGQQYYLFVANDATSSSPATDYYFAQHFVGSYYYGQIEAEGATGMGVNDTQATAQVLTTPSGGEVGTYFIDGDISKAGDVDWFEIDIPPAGDNLARMYCASARAGSGVVGLTATLYASDGPTVLGTMGPETATASLYNSMMAVPAGTTKTFLKLSATSQSATNVGTSYLCQIYFLTM